MIKGMPNIPDMPNPENLVQSGIDAAISFGGAFAIRMVFGDSWGIFNQYGVPILLADNVTSVEYRNTATVATAPLERGTFATYNKVQDPYTATVQMTKGSGSPAQRGLFIAQLEMLSKSTLLFNVLTPEYVHRRAAIVGFGYKRMPQDGARIIVANIDLKEVREVNVGYEKVEVKSPQDSAVVNSGEVKPQESESLLSSAARNIGSFLRSIRDKGVSALKDLTSQAGTQ